MEVGCATVQPALLLEHCDPGKQVHSLEYLHPHLCAGLLGAGVSVSPIPECRHFQASWEQDKQM